MPAAARGNARRDRPRRGVRCWRRGLDPYMLCGGSFGARTRDGAAHQIPARDCMIKGFKDFLLKNNVLALAVAVIVGGAVGKVVSSLAADIIMPLISPALPAGDWRQAKIVLGSTIGKDGKPVENAIQYGSFLGNVVDFLIIAFVVYVLTKALIKEATPAPAKTCPRCKESVAIDATRCKFCTADI